jgi:archaellum component FlaC
MPDELDYVKAGIHGIWLAIKSDTEDLKRGQTHLAFEVSQVRTHLEQHDRKFQAIDGRFNEVDQRFNEVDQRFNEVDERFDHIDERLDGHDSQFEAVKGGLDKLDSKLDVLVKLVKSK